MPAYKTTSYVTAPMPGDTFVAFNNETPTPGVNAAAGAASERIALMEGGPYSVEGTFSGAPGAFELDFQTSDTDADANFALEGTGITTLNADGVSFRGEFLSVAAKFGRLLMKSRTSAVAVTARITRRARGVK